ncbi:hypothetical protein ACJ72_07201, partial [Emergomyces africanus]
MCSKTKGEGDPAALNKGHVGGNQQKGEADYVSSMAPFSPVTLIYHSANQQPEQTLLGTQWNLAMPRRGKAGLGEVPDTAMVARTNGGGTLEEEAKWGKEVVGSSQGCLGWGGAGLSHTPPQTLYG